MGALLGIDQNASHGLEEVIEDLFEVGGLFEGGRISKDVTFKDLQEELDVNS